MQMEHVKEQTMQSLPRAEWARAVLTRSQGRCACGSDTDVRACYLTPPSLGGRNVEENGIALCEKCRVARDDKTHAVRVSLSLDQAQAEELNRRAERGGRSVAEILRQLAADGLDAVPAPVYPNGKPTSRVSVMLSKDVYEGLLGAVGHRARVGGALAALVAVWLAVETKIVVQEPLGEPFGEPERDPE